VLKKQEILDSLKSRGGGGSGSQKNLISENFFRFPKSIFKKVTGEQVSVCKLAGAKNIG
jgi:hypothetical protein